MHSKEPYATSFCCYTTLARLLYLAPAGSVSAEGTSVAIGAGVAGSIVVSGRGSVAAGLALAARGLLAGLTGLLNLSGVDALAVHGLQVLVNDRLDDVLVRLDDVDGLHVGGRVDDRLVDRRDPGADHVASLGALTSRGLESTGVASVRAGIAGAGIVRTDIAATGVACSGAVSSSTVSSRIVGALAAGGVAAVGVVGTGGLDGLGCRCGDRKSVV